MTMSIAAAKRLLCRQGQRGVSTTISPLSLSWIWEIDRVGCKSGTILQHSYVVILDVSGKKEIFYLDSLHRLNGTDYLIIIQQIQEV